MSFNSMLAHRCTLYDSVESSSAGSSTYSWVAVATDVPCFIDLNFLRKGKDMMWVEAAGRPQDRTGVIFFKGSENRVKSGQRIDITKGPNGMFSIEGALDEAWTPRKRHHLEFGVIEVATVIKRADRVNT